MAMPGMSAVELARGDPPARSVLPVEPTSGYGHVLAKEGRHRFELLHEPYAVADLSRVLRQMT